MKKRPDHNWQYREKHYSLYYQPQPSIQNHRQQYRHYRKIKQAYSKNDYDTYKGGAYGMIHSEICTPEKHKTPIIPLGDDSYSRKKTD